jgi:hypothetical protein
MSTVDPHAEHVDESEDEEYVCHHCTLVNALTEWRDSDGPVEAVVEAISDMLHGALFAALDDIFDEPNEDRTEH